LGFQSIRTKWRTQEIDCQNMGTLVFSERKGKVCRKAGTAVPAFCRNEPDNPATAPAAAVGAEADPTDNLAQGFGSTVGNDFTHSGTHQRQQQVRLHMRMLGHDGRMRERDAELLDFPDVAGASGIKAGKYDEVRLLCGEPAHHLPLLSNQSHQLVPAGFKPDIGSLNRLG
jgi:hypothetical protein